jgi:hypothetical protein
MATPLVQNQVPLAQDLRAILPIGIPLGWQRKTSNGSHFAIRRGGRFYYLDEEGQCLWAAAWTGPSRQNLIDFMAAQWKQERDRASADLDRFLAARLVAQLGGDWHEDWDRIASFRVLPRSFVFDSHERSGFRLLSPDGCWEVWLDMAEYAVWTCLDGTVQLGQAVAQAAEATRLSLALLKERAHSFLIAAVRIRAVFIDELGASGGA